MTRCAMRRTTGCLRIGSRQERHAARRARRVGTIGKRRAGHVGTTGARGARHVVTTGKRRAATAIRMCGLRFVMRFVEALSDRAD